MEKVFVKTENYTEFADICNELVSPDSDVGPSLAMVTGRAGRGKTEAAKYYAVQSDAVYIRTLPVMSPLMVLREIAFELSGTKPYSTAKCLEAIENEAMKARTLILVDEADLVKLDVLETLRGVNERCGTPIVLIGEDELKDKVARRTRIMSRIRRKMDFGNITQADVALFFKQALHVEPENKAVSAFYRYSKGDWRPLVKIAADAERAMRASGVGEITGDMAKELVKNA